MTSLRTTFESSASCKSYRIQVDDNFFLTWQDDGMKFFLDYANKEMYTGNVPSKGFEKGTSPMTMWIDNYK